MVFRFLIIALIVLLAGCSDDETEDIIKEIYVGSMFFDINPGVIGRSFEDTVRLTIDGTAYDFETLVHTVTNWSPLCDVTGNVSGFGGTSADFTAVKIKGSGCSSKYTLQGVFPTVFAGDSLFMIKTDTFPLDTAVYVFRLGRQPSEVSTASYLPIR